MVRASPPLDGSELGNVGTLYDGFVILLKRGGVRSSVKAIMHPMRPPYTLSSRECTNAPPLDFKAYLSSRPSLKCGTLASAVSLT